MSRRDPGARCRHRGQALCRGSCQVAESCTLLLAAFSGALPCSSARPLSPCASSPGTACFGGSAPRAAAQPWPAAAAASQKRCSPIPLLHLVRSTLVLSLAEDASAVHALGSRGAAPALLAGTRRASTLCTHHGDKGSFWSLLLAHLLPGRPQLFLQQRGGYSRPCAGGRLGRRNNGK